MMTINKSMDQGTATIAIEGWLETKTAPDLAAELDNLEEGIQNLVLDFSRLEYISSAGLRLVVSAHKKMNGNLVIKNASSGIMSIFKATGLDKRIRFENGEESQSS